MKAATWQGESRFTLDEVPEPTPGTGQVLVAVHTAGICGTDVHATQGLFPWRPPLVMGHEYTGVIVDVGRGVSRRLIGRAVACEPNYGCGECVECRAGRVSHCPRISRAGGFAERVALPRSAVQELPDGLDPATAALTEPAACCLAGLEMFKMPRAATVLVIGGGIMGLLTMALAKKRGAARAILSDPIAERREIASRLGADHVIDPVREDLRETVKELTGGRGPDVACEAVGKPELVAEAIAMVKPMGIVQLVGVSPKGAPAPGRPLRCPLPRAEDPGRLRPRHLVPPGARRPAVARRRLADHRALSPGADRRRLRPRRGGAGGEDRHHPRGLAGNAEAGRGVLALVLKVVLAERIAHE